MRVRWAFEEVGQPYDVRLVSFEEVEAPEHLALHPFGRIPTFELGTLVLFESGAIVFHIAERHDTVEPPIMNLSMLKIVERDKGWLEARLPLVEDQVRRRPRPALRLVGGGGMARSAYRRAFADQLAFSPRQARRADFPQLRNW